MTVLAKVTYRVFGFKITKTFVIPTASLIIENAGLLGDSVGILFTGDMFPFPSPVICSVEFDVLGNPASVPHFAIPELAFHAPGRLRLMIHNLTGTAPWGTQIESNFSWLVDMFQALERLSAMMPVRDGVKLGLTHADAGINYVFGDNLDPWPAVCPSGSAPPCTDDEMLRGQPARDQRDQRQPERRSASMRPSPGGRATSSFRRRAARAWAAGPGSTTPQPGTGVAGLVGGNLRGKEFTGAILAQEIGHLFGLEPKDSPHFEDPLDGLHSKDPAHNDPFAFDFYLLKPYQPPPGAFLGDVMNNMGGGVGQGSDMVLYNAFDWEHLRKKFVKLPGVARAAAPGDPPKEAQKDMTATLDASLANVTAIKVDNPGKALPTRPGYAWHWTGRGFQPAARGATSKGRAALAPSVEGLRDWLHDRGVTEFYAPVGDRPLPVVINPDAPTILQRKGVGGMYWL